MRLLTRSGRAWSHQSEYCFFFPYYSLQENSETIVRMLKVYPEARTFRASTWSEFTILWDADCTEYHNHTGEEVGPIPVSKAPSLRALGLLPTEDVQARESRLCQAPTQDSVDTGRTSARGAGNLVRVFWGLSHLSWQTILTC